MAQQMVQKGVSGADMVAILQTWKLWPVAWRDTSSSKLKTSMSNPPSLLCVSRQTLGGRRISRVPLKASDERLSKSPRLLLFPPFLPRSHAKYENTHSRYTFGKLWTPAGGGFKPLVPWSYSWREQGSSFLFYTAIPTEYVAGLFCTQGLHGPRAEPIEKPGTPQMETLKEYSQFPVHTAVFSTSSAIQGHLGRVQSVTNSIRSCRKCAALNSS